MLIIKRWAGVLITLLACVTRGKCVILTHLLEQRPIMHLELQMQAKMKDWIKERSQFSFSNQIRDWVRSRQRSSSTRKQNCLVMTGDLMLSTTQELAARHSQREDGWGCVGPTALTPPLSFLLWFLSMETVCCDLNSGSFPSANQPVCLCAFNFHRDTNRI